MKFLGLLVFVFCLQNGFAQEATVSVKLKPAGSFKAVTKNVKGYVIQNGNSFEAKEIQVGLNDLDSGIDLRTQHMKNYLEIDKFPNATLISAKGKDGIGEGLIQIRGKTKAISGTYKVEGKKIIAEFPLSLSDFEITGISYMKIGVDDKVNVVVSLPIDESSTKEAGKK